jgi:hypothetical protein
MQLSLQIYICRLIATKQRSFHTVPQPMDHRLWIVYFQLDHNSVCKWLLENTFHQTTYRISRHDAEIEEKVEMLMP